MDKQPALILASNQKIVIFLQTTAKISCIAVIFIGLFCFVTSPFGITFTATIFPDVVGMSPFVAIGFISSAGALLLQITNANKKNIFLEIFAIFLSCVTFLIGSITSIDFLMKKIFGYDPLFIDKILDKGVTLDITLSFILIGTALLLLPVPQGRHFTRVAQGLTLIAALLSMFAVLSYLYSSVSFYKIFQSPMPLSSAITFSLLSMALLFARPNRGFTKVLTRSTPSSILAFRLIFVILTIPAIFGFFVLQAEQLHMINDQTGLTLLVLSSICFLSIAVWVNSSVSQKLEIENIIIKNELEKKNVTLEIDSESLATKMLALEEEKEEVVDKLNNEEKLIDLEEN